MSRLPRVIFLIAAVFMSTASFATTFAVGNCKPNSVEYATISAAVSDPKTANSTIQVCPGTYNEQVLITQPLTLQGVTIGNNSAAVITLPSGAAQTMNGDNIGIVAYQIGVQNPGGPVNLKDLIVDGTGASNLGFVGFLGGIFYEDASGTVTNVNARNQVYQSSGVGIFVASGQINSASQTVTIQKSVFNNFDSVGMFTVAAAGLDLTIDSNFVDGASSAQVGILFSGTGVVKSNVVGGTVRGLSLENSSATATANTIQGGISIVAGSNTVTGDSIDAGGRFGVQIQGTGSNTVKSNTIVNSSTAVYGCGSNLESPPASGDTVSGNTILDASIGIQMPSGNTTIPNTFELVPAATQACP
jgi:hypothetical protein